MVQAQSLDSKITALKLIDALLGKGPCKISSWKKPPTNVSQKYQIEHVVANFLIDGYLKEDFHFTPYNTISYILPGNVPLKSEIMLKIPSSSTIKSGTQNKGVKRKKSSTPKIIDVSDSE